MFSALSGIYLLTVLIPCIQIAHKRSTTGVLATVCIVGTVLCLEQRPATTTQIVLRLTIHLYALIDDGIAILITMTLSILLLNPYERGNHAAQGGHPEHHPEDALSDAHRL